MPAISPLAIAGIVSVAVFGSAVIPDSPLNAIASRMLAAPAPVVLADASEKLPGKAPAEQAPPKPAVVPGPHPVALTNSPAIGLSVPPTSTPPTLKEVAKDAVSVVQEKIKGKAKEPVKTEVKPAAAAPEPAKTDAKPAESKPIPAAAAKPKETRPDKPAPKRHVVKPVPAPASRDCFLGIFC